MQTQNTRPDKQLDGHEGHQESTEIYILTSVSL